MNGFGLTSANDVPTRDVENFRLYAKVLKEEEKVEECDDELVKGFELMTTIKDEKFANRFENKRYAFEQ